MDGITHDFQSVYQVTNDQGQSIATVTERPDGRFVVEPALRYLEPEELTRLGYALDYAARMLLARKEASARNAAAFAELDRLAANGAVMP